MAFFHYGLQNVEMRAIWPLIGVKRDTSVFVMSLDLMKGSRASVNSSTLPQSGVSSPSHPHTLLHTPQSVPSHSGTLYTLVSLRALSRSLTSLVNTLTSTQLGFTQKGILHTQPRRERLSYWKVSVTHRATWGVACHASLSTISGSPVRASSGETGKELFCSVTEMYINSIIFLYKVSPK